MEKDYKGVPGQVLKPDSTVDLSWEEPMIEEIKNLPKKYFQITDENKRDRMVAYVRLDEVLEILEQLQK
jgi:hypothetical protein